MTQEDSQTKTGEVLLAAFDLIAGTSESTRAKTAETFLELLGARVRNPNTRSAYRVAWRSFLAFCSARQLELEGVKAYHVGTWLDQHPGSRSTQKGKIKLVQTINQRSKYGYGQCQILITRICATATRITLTKMNRCSSLLSRSIAKSRSVVLT